MDKVSYALGLGIGQQLAQMGATDLSIDDFADAIKDVLQGKDLKVSHKDAQTIVQNYFKEKETKLNAERETQGKIAREAGEAFLKEKIRYTDIAVVVEKVLNTFGSPELKTVDEVMNADSQSREIAIQAVKELANG